MGVRFEHEVDDGGGGGEWLEGEPLADEAVITEGEPLPLGDDGLISDQSVQGGNQKAQGLEERRRVDHQLPI